MVQILSLIEYLLGIALFDNPTHFLNTVSQLIFVILALQAGAITLYIHLLAKAAIRNENRARPRRAGIIVIAFASFTFPFLVTGVATLTYSISFESLIATVGPFLIPSVASGILLSLAGKDVTKKKEFFNMSSKTKYWEP